jgi:hypothetical protein
MQDQDLIYLDVDPAPEFVRQHNEFARQKRSAQRFVEAFNRFMEAFPDDDTPDSPF